MWMVSEQGLKLMWSGATMIGLRTLRHTLPSQYRDTAYCFEQAEGCVCLTIDDGLCRNGEQASLVRREKKETCMRNYPDA